VTGETDLLLRLPRINDGCSAVVPTLRTLLARGTSLETNRSASRRTSRVEDLRASEHTALLSFVGTLASDSRPSPGAVPRTEREPREEVLLKDSSCARQKRKLRLRAQAFHPLLGKTGAFKPVFCKEQARNLAIASPSSSLLVRNKLLRILSGSPHRWDHAELLQHAEHVHMCRKSKNSLRTLSKKPLPSCGSWPGILAMMCRGRTF
jgi:hypothetical protein